MRLIEITPPHYNKITAIYTGGGGDLINASLTKLFECMDDQSNIHEVRVKVAALNKIYSTSINFIEPVVEKIIKIVPEKHSALGHKEYAKLVDEISTISWVNPTTKKSHKRCNLSFSSKYIHFLSNRITPIYDSYIWIVMIGYMAQYGSRNYSFSAPKSYQEFYTIFCEFKGQFSLDKYSNYEIDKFLWQYGKNMLNAIIEEEGVNLSKAKTILKHRITKSLQATR